MWMETRMNCVCKTGKGYVVIKNLILTQNNSEIKYAKRGTHKLDGCHVLLPPQVFLEARPCSRESVVEVHDNMDYCVHQRMEGGHSSNLRRQKPQKIELFVILMHLYSLSKVTYNPKVFFNHGLRPILIHYHSFQVAKHLDIVLNLVCYFDIMLSKTLPGVRVMPHHHVQGMKEWWNTWRNVIWFCFFLSTKNAWYI